MSSKLRPNLLAKDELEYELRVRGIATGTVEEMRKSLAGALRIELQGSRGETSFKFSTDSESFSLE